MADTPIGTQAPGLRGDGAHQFVGVQAAFHQQLTSSGVDQLYRLCSGFIAMCCVNKLEGRDVETMHGGRIPNLPFRSDQERPDNAGLCTIDSAAQ
jgi:hypothetical protein